MNIYTIKQRSSQLISTLLKIWEDSVRATHLFLSEEDIKSLKPLVQSYILAIPHLIIMEEVTPIAFMGIEDQKIEMLFITPEQRKKGLGSSLVTYALKTMKVKYVDVNEQNIEATKFYQHLGFTLLSRSKLDSQGKPFPILHLIKNKS